MSRPLRPLADELAELAQRRRRLDQLDDAISSQIPIIENALRAHLSVRVETKAGFGVLAFGKQGGRWRLLVENDGIETALASCPRAVRVEAFAGGHVHALILGARQQMDAMIADRGNAIDIATMLIDQLGGRPDAAFDNPNQGGQHGAAGGNRPEPIDPVIGQRNTTR